MTWSSKQRYYRSRRTQLVRAHDSEWGAEAAVDAYCLRRVEHFADAYTVCVSGFDSAQEVITVLRCVESSSRVFGDVDTDRDHHRDR